jgi:hypothetical protein
LFGLLGEIVDGSEVGPVGVDFPEAFIFELEALLEVFEIVIPLESFPFEELNFVLLGLIGHENFLHVADVVVLHQNLKSNNTLHMNC